MDKRGKPFLQRPTSTNGENIRILAKIATDVIIAKVVYRSRLPKNESHTVFAALFFHVLKKSFY